MIKNSFILSLFILFSLNSSEKDDSENSKPLQKEERMNLPSSKEELDKEIEDYFKQYGLPDIPMVKSTNNLEELN